MAIISSTSSYEDEAMRATMEPDGREVGADLLHQEQKGVLPTSTKVVELLLDMLVLAATSSTTPIFAWHLPLHRPPPVDTANRRQPLLGCVQRGLPRRRRGGRGGIAPLQRPPMAPLAPSRVLAIHGGRLSRRPTMGLPVRMLFGLQAPVPSSPGTAGEHGGWAVLCACPHAWIAGAAAAVRSGGSVEAPSPEDSKDAARNQSSPSYSQWRGLPHVLWGPGPQRGDHAASRSSTSMSRGPRQDLSAKLHLAFYFFFILAACMAICFMCPFLSSCHGMRALQPQVLLSTVPTRQLLLKSWVDDSALPLVTGVSFFCPQRQHQQYSSVVGMVLLQRLRRSTLNRRYARSVHLGARVFDAPANTPHRQNRSPQRLSRRCCLLFWSQDHDVLGLPLRTSM